MYHIMMSFWLTKGCAYSPNIKMKLKDCYNLMALEPSKHRSNMHSSLVCGDADINKATVLQWVKNMAHTNMYLIIGMIVLLVYVLTVLYFYNYFRGQLFCLLRSVAVMHMP